MVQDQFHKGTGGRDAGIAARESEGAEVGQWVVAEVELAQAGQMLEGARAHLVQAAAAEVERSQLRQRRPAGKGAGREHGQLVAGKEEVAHVGGRSVGTSVRLRLTHLTVRAASEHSQSAGHWSGSGGWADAAEARNGAEEEEEEDAKEVGEDEETQPRRTSASRASRSRPSPAAGPREHP